MPRVVFSLIYFILATNLYGQVTSELTLSGIIVDSETLEPLPYAHVVLNGKLGTQPNINGIFKLPIKHNDTLTISHVGYRSEHRTIETPIKGTTYNLTIFMSRDMTLLKAIEVTPLPASEASFKQAILELEVGPKLSASMEEQHGRITFDMILGPKVSYDAYENYRGIGQPKEFTLFSTGPVRGILRALKSLKSKKKRK